MTVLNLDMDGFGEFPAYLEEINSGLTIPLHVLNEFRVLCRRRRVLFSMNNSALRVDGSLQLSDLRRFC